MSPRLRTERSIISPVFVINLVGSFLYGLLIMPVANPNALDIHYGASGSVIFWCTAVTTGLLGGRFSRRSRVPSASSCCWGMM